MAMDDEKRILAVVKYALMAINVVMIVRICVIFASFLQSYEGEDNRVPISYAINLIFNSIFGVILPCFGLCAARFENFVLLAIYVVLLAINLVYSIALGTYKYYQTTFGLILAAMVTAIALLFLIKHDLGSFAGCSRRRTPPPSPTVVHCSAHCANCNGHRVTFIDDEN